MLYRDPCVFAGDSECQTGFNAAQLGIAWGKVDDKRYQRGETGRLIYRIAVSMTAQDAARGFVYASSLT